MTAINQKEYLKKYLGIGKAPGEKKKKKKKPVGDRLKIIDDNADVLISQEIQEDISAANEDAPQIVAVIDERPPSLRIDEQTKSNLWTPIGGDSTSSETFKLSSSFKLQKQTKSSLRNDSRLKPHYTRIEVKREEESSPKRSKDNDRSPPRVRRGSDYSPPKRSIKIEEDSPRRRSSGDDSPPRRRNRGDNDNSPLRRRNREGSSSPRRSREASLNRRDNDNSPPRRSRDVSLNRSDKDSSPRRRSRDASSSRKGKDNSPPRRKNRDDRSRSSSQRKYESDHSPPRKRERDQSPTTRIKIDDNSPPRRNRAMYPSSRDIDSSPPRRRNNDLSPPRRIEKYSPPRKNKEDYSSPRTRGADDMSPPRRRNRDDTPPRRKNRDSDSASASSPRNRNKARASRWGDWSPETSQTSEKFDKLKRTLDGKKAGLQNAKDMVKETALLKQKEDEIFQGMSAEVSGRNAATVVRAKKTQDPEEIARQLEKERKTKEKYDRWGKGVKQVDEQNERIAEQLHEMSKPLARYADDEDLEKYLREQEREGDPMLAYIRKKKKKQAVAAGIPEKPTYMGEFMPNRFGIRPGYRWDGVDRSSGYEKRWFEVQNAKKASQEDAFKWSTEDM